MPTVSVLLPVYNTSKYLDRCLESLENQTFSDIEMILINDGSTDESLEICQQHAKKDGRVHVFSYENGGISKTRNRALSHAEGEFVMFVDSDDYVDVRMVDALVRASRKRNLDVVQCGFVMDFGPVPFYRLSSGNQDYTTVQAMHAIAREDHLNNYPWGKLYRRICFDHVRFPEDMRGFEDTCTVFKALANAKRIGTIPNRYYHYAQRMGSLTNCMDLKTVYLMRRAYLYQKATLQKLFPDETFSFDQQLYNTDMVIIYTLILFCHRKDDPKFLPADFSWDNLDFSPILHLAYVLWLGIAHIKLTDSILDVSDEQFDRLCGLETESA